VEYEFGNVDAVAVGRDGTIWVADRVPIIRIYDAQGRFVRNVGRKGAGPGEYEAIGGMRALPDGRVALWDNRNQRITVFTPTGDLAATHLVASGLFSDDVFQVDRDGIFYVRSTVGRLVPGVPWDFGWIRVSPSGKVLDTIPVPKGPDRPPAFSIGADRSFPTDLVTTMGSLGYLITGLNDTYAFDQHRRGAPILRIERPFTPIALGREERAEWEAEARRFEEAVARPQVRPGIVTPPPRKISYTIPQTKPAFSELQTDSRGRIWVKRYVAAQRRPAPQRSGSRPPRLWREPPTYDVFEPGGRFLGTVTLPWRATFLDAIDRHVWATVLGESDEQYVVRFRIDG
jgi:hypothetical protein